MDKVAQLESRRNQLQQDIVQKNAYIAGLPPVEVVQLKEPAIRFVRLRNPKAEGQSLKKKQCDLWEFCWGSGALLAYVLVNTVDWTGKTTIELGGGIGLATLALCEAFETKRSVMTDLVADALKVFELSTQVQPMKGCTETRVLNWNRPEESCESRAYDLVMGSDVLFMGWCAPAVAKVAARCLAPNGLILIVDPYRLNDPAFIESLDGLGICHHKVFEFPPEMVERLVVPVLDDLGSVVPVKRAKLIVASRCEIPARLVEALQTKAGLVL